MHIPSILLTLEMQAMINLSALVCEIQLHHLVVVRNNKNVITFRMILLNQGLIFSTIGSMHQ